MKPATLADFWVGKLNTRLHCLPFTAWHQAVLAAKLTCTDLHHLHNTSELLCVCVFCVCVCLMKPETVSGKSTDNEDDPAAGKCCFY